MIRQSPVSPAQRLQLLENNGLYCDGLPNAPPDMFLISKLKNFLTRTNNIMLVLGIIAAASINRAFIAFLDDIFAPLLEHTLGIRDWSAGQFVLSQTVDASGNLSLHAVKFGHFGGILFDLFITAIVVLTAARWLRKHGSPKQPKTPWRCRQCGAVESDQSNPHAGPMPIDFRPDTAAQVINSAPVRETNERATSIR